MAAAAAVEPWRETAQRERMRKVWDTGRAFLKVGASGSSGVSHADIIAVAGSEGDSWRRPRPRPRLLANVHSVTAASVALLIGASSCKPKGCQFQSRLGHMPGLRV